MPIHCIGKDNEVKLALAVTKTGTMTQAQGTIFLSCRLILVLNTAPRLDKSFQSQGKRVGL